MILDNLLIISILLVFLTAVIGTFAKRRRKDRVLKHIDGFHITLARHNKASVWGEVKVFSNGLEFIFNETYKNRRGNTASSFLLYKQEFSEVLGLFRYHDELSVTKQKQRRREVKAVVSKSWNLMLGRMVGNFLNTFSDAINESMGMLLNRVGSAKSNTKLKELSSTTTSLLSAAYDPLLEHHIGDLVILEQTQEDKKIEYVGTLHEYSDTWISLYDCQAMEDGDEREVDVFLPRAITCLRNAGAKKSAAN